MDGLLGTTSVQQVLINILYIPSAMDTGKKATDFRDLPFMELSRGGVWEGVERWKIKQENTRVGCK